MRYPIRLKIEHVSMIKRSVRCARNVQSIKRKGTWNGQVLIQAGCLEQGAGRHEVEEGTEPTLTLQAAWADYHFLYYMWFQLSGVHRMRHRNRIQT